MTKQLAKCLVDEVSIVLLEWCVELQAFSHSIVFHNLTYKERLQRLKLPTLVYRRARGDMIEVYKILHGYYDPEAAPCLQQCIYLSTRGHTLKLYQLQSHLNCRKCSFTVRVAGRWNKLPDDVVNAPSIPSFENRLDKHWACQEFLYDFKAQLPWSWYSLHHT